MVYIYLVHYAEMEPEAALLAINTLKKELSNPNQLIRANALRTMSSIRVRLIAQLVGLAVKQASSDSSPYVRKAAAHAIPKLVRYVTLSRNHKMANSEAEMSGVEVSTAATSDRHMSPHSYAHPARCNVLCTPCPHLTDQLFSFGHLQLNSVVWTLTKRNRC